MSQYKYTKDGIADSIDRELSWRKKELKVFKDTIPTQSSPKQDALLRCSIPIIYAHWEGFVKRSCELYLEYVSNRNDILKNLKPQFIAIALRNAIQAQEIKKISERTKAVQYIIDNLESSTKLPTKNVIATKSNLKYEVFEDICHLLCIRTDEFSKKKELIDNLVDTRNTIAHGNYDKISYKLFCEFYNDVIILLETLRTEIENAVAMDNHKR